jgi:hypothetical protein
VGGESPIDEHQRTAARNRIEKTSHILRRSARLPGAGPAGSSVT